MKTLHKVVLALVSSFAHGTSNPAPQGNRLLGKKTTAPTIDANENWETETAETSLIRGIGKSLVIGTVISGLLLAPVGRAVPPGIASFTACDENTGMGSIVYAADWDLSRNVHIGADWYASDNWPYEDAPIWEQFVRDVKSLHLYYERCLAQAEDRKAIARLSAVKGLNRDLYATAIAFFSCLSALALQDFDPNLFWYYSPVMPGTVPGDYLHPPSRPKLPRNPVRGVPWLTWISLGDCIFTAILGEVVTYYGYNSSMDTANDILETDIAICKSLLGRGRKNAEKNRDERLAKAQERREEEERRRVITTPDDCNGDGVPDPRSRSDYRWDSN